MRRSTNGRAQGVVHVAPGERLVGVDDAVALRPGRAFELPPQPGDDVDLRRQGAELGIGRGRLGTQGTIEHVFQLVGLVAEVVEDVAEAGRAARLGAQAAVAEPVSVKRQGPARPRCAASGIRAHAGRGLAP